MPKKMSLDELAANLPDDVKRAHGITMNESYEEIRANEHPIKNYEAVEKAGYVEWDDASPAQEEPDMWSIATNNPADLTKNAFSYNKRNNRFWSEKDLDDMEKAEEEHADKGFVDWS